MDQYLSLVPVDYQWMLEDLLLNVMSQMQNGLMLCLLLHDIVVQDQILWELYEEYNQYNPE